MKMQTSMTKKRFNDVKEHIAKAIEAIDEKNDAKSAIQHLIWAVAWISDEVFVMKDRTEEIRKLKADLAQLRREFDEHYQDYHPQDVAEGGGDPD